MRTRERERWGPTYITYVPLPLSNLIGAAHRVFYARPRALRREREEKGAGRQAGSNGSLRVCAKAEGASERFIGVESSRSMRIAYIYSTGVPYDG